MWVFVFFLVGSTLPTGLWSDTSKWELSTSKFFVVISITFSPLVLYVLYKLWKCVGTVNCDCGRPNDNNESSGSGNSDDKRWFLRLRHVAKAWIATWRVTDVKYSGAISRIDDETHGDTSGHGLTDQHGDTSGHGLTDQHGDTSGHGLTDQHGDTSGHGLTDQHGDTSGQCLTDQHGEDCYPDVSNEGVNLV